jgi:hypothetical protein
MTPRPSAVPAVSEVYELLRYAAMRRQPVTAVYDGQPRVLCPHVGGRKKGRPNVFCYQFGGGSNSIEALPSQDKGVWRCLAVERLSQVELHPGAWQTESRPKRQTCIDEVDFDIDGQPGDDPQNGQ